MTITQIASETTKERPKLSICEQIQHMKSKGITFNIVSEEEAAVYLENNTYYFKIKCYAKLYEKYYDTPQKGQYINLDFAYLQDLANIDALLRKKIIQVSLDIEHYLHAALLRDFNKTTENGYDIIRNLFIMNPEHYDKEIGSKRYGKACSNLVQKYDGNFAIWNIVEILGLNDFLELYRYFYLLHGEELYGKPYGPFQYYINPVRLLRNGAAHNNCLINSLKSPYVSGEYFNRNLNVISYIGQHCKKYGVANTTINKNMNRPLVHDFCVMLHLFHLIAPKTAQLHVYSEFYELFTGRFVRHADYYKNKNATIESTYNFVLNVIQIYKDLS